MLPLRLAISLRESSFDVHALKSSREIVTLAQAFDRWHGLQFASTGFINVIFAAGTVHLLASVQTDTLLVRDTGFTRALLCVEALRAMAWASAVTSAQTLQQMLDEWRPLHL